MDIIVSAIAVVVAAGCFLAIVASDLREDERLFSLRDAAWADPEKSKSRDARK